MTPSTIAGVAIPDSRLANDTTAFVRDLECDLLYHHSLRVFVFGSLRGRHRQLAYDPELLYVGAMFHDVGLVEGDRSHNCRFAVGGASTARAFLQQRGIDPRALRLVWDVIALQPGRCPAAPDEPERALVSAGVELDVLGLGQEDVTAAQRHQVLSELPRVEFLQEFILAFRAALAHQPQCALAGATSDAEATRPGYRRPNVCEAILGFAIRAAARPVR